MGFQKAKSGAESGIRSLQKKKLNFSTEQINSKFHMQCALKIFSLKWVEGESGD